MKKSLIVALLLSCFSLAAHAEYDKLTDVVIGTNGRFVAFPPEGYPAKYVQVVDAQNKEIQKIPAHCAFGNLELARKMNFYMIDALEKLHAKLPNDYKDELFFCISEKGPIAINRELNWRSSYDYPHDAVLRQRAPSMEAWYMPMHYLFLAVREDDGAVESFIIMAGRPYVDLPAEKSDKPKTGQAR